MRAQAASANEGSVAAEWARPVRAHRVQPANLHVYLSQTDRGECVIGAEIDPYQSYSMKGTLPTLEQMATYTLELFPQLHNVKILRQWARLLAHHRRR